MRLSEFIISHRESIMQQWEDFAATILPDAQLDSKALRDHISHLLEFISRDMGTSQNKLQQCDKSQGLGKKEGGVKDSAAEMHAALRYTEGFDIIQTASEFRALRASVISLWNKERDKSEDDCADVNRFHESIDQILMEALTRHHKDEERATNLFLGTLVHDMRSPLGAISNSVELMKMIGGLDDTQKKMIDQIDRSGKTVVKLVSDLIDTARAQLGQGMPITPALMNIGDVARHAAKEAEISAQRGTVSVETQGNLDGEWDNARIGQVFSNLIGNALQHGSGEAVKVTAKGEAEGVALSVHNVGKPIPMGEIASVFEPLKRGQDEEQKQTESSSMGLGLFITREIIVAHGGKIDVASSQEEGTTFSAWLPRRPGPAHTTH